MQPALAAVPAIFGAIKASFLALRMKQLLCDQDVNRFLKIPHLSAITFYILFDLTQILNYAQIFINDNCRTWYIISMLFLWFGRFSIGFEIVTRCIIIFSATALQIRWKPVIIPTFIFCIIVLLLILILNSSIEVYSICIPQYNNSILPMMMIHLYDTCLSCGSALYMVFTLRRIFSSMLAGLPAHSAQHRMYRYYIKKFSIYLCILLMSSIFIFMTIYVPKYYGILLSMDGTIMLFMNMILYRQYTKIFGKIFFCFCLPDAPERAQPAAKMQDLIDIIAEKYDDKYSEIISKGLKNPNYYLFDDLVNTIIEYIKPIKNMKQANIWRPRFNPTLTLKTINNDNIYDNLKYFKCSKYGGIPYLASFETWPRCATCGNKLYLHLQLNMNDLAEEYLIKHLSNAQKMAYQNKIFQYFQCIEYDCCRKETIKQTSLTRFIEIDDGRNMESKQQETDEKQEKEEKEEKKEEKKETNDGTIDYEKLQWTNVFQQFDEFRKLHGERDKIYEARWAENIITVWNKATTNNYRDLTPTPKDNDDDENEEEKDGFVEEEDNFKYDFEKYRYEAPSMREYEIFYMGVFNDFSDIEKEIELKKLNMNKLRTESTEIYKGDKLFGYYYCFGYRTYEDQLQLKLPRCKLCNNLLNHMLYQTDATNVGYTFRNSLIAAIFVCDHHPLEPEIVFMSWNDLLIM